MNKINLRPALASMDHDEDILYAVLAAFIEEVPSLMNELEQALAKSDKTTTERVSHTLKGNFRILQLQNQQTVWANIEQLAHNDQLAQIPALVPEAKVVTQTVLEQIESALASRQL
ncbi:MAG: Hpt domain-containing protein [Rubripirellula sp.]|jgi:HPt (histidine-containing phosphotransfer) domain-containing protein